MPNNGSGGYAIRLLMLGVLVCGYPQADTTQPNEVIAIDTRAASGELLGFGTQIWVSEFSPIKQRLLEELDIDYVRLSAAPDWYKLDNAPPVDTGAEAMDQYVSQQFEKNPAILSQVQKAFGFFNTHHIQAVMLIWAAPKSWQPVANELLPQYLDDYARLWGATLHYLDQHNISPSYIELVNEPHGHWSCYIPPPRYNDLVKLVRRELDRRGLRKVGIVGPGVAAQVGAKWVDSLDADGKSAIRAWSAHSYEGEVGTSGRTLQPFVDSVARITPEKSIFITEYSTKYSTFEGLNTIPNDAANASGGIKASHSAHYAVQVFQNTLELINRGANSLFYWELGDHQWSNNEWGLLDRKEREKPVSQALRSLYPEIPDSAKVIQPKWQARTITLSALKSQDKLILALANNSAQSVGGTLNPIPARPIRGLVHKAFETAVEPTTNNNAQVVNGNAIRFAMTPQSTLTIIISY